MKIDIPKEEVNRYLGALRFDLTRGKVVPVEASVIEVDPGVWRLYVTYRFTEAPE